MMAFKMDNRWVNLVIRWIIGLTFIVASLHKIAEPAAFAKIIYGYDLFPHFSINILAIILPFMELLAGILLVLNIYPKAAAFIIGVLLLAFIIAISINMARGHVFDCGCFSFGSDDLLTGSKNLLIRDTFLLILCIYPLGFSGGTFTKRAIFG